MICTFQLLSWNLWVHSFGIIWSGITINHSLIRWFLFLLHCYILHLFNKNLSLAMINNSVLYMSCKNTFSQKHGTFFTWPILYKNEQYIIVWNDSKQIIVFRKKYIRVSNLSISWIKNFSSIIYHWNLLTKHICIFVK